MAFFDDEYGDFNIAEARVDGIAKVTGKGKYSAEYQVEGLCYGVLVGSTIPAGRIESFQLDYARQVGGVIDIITHLNKPTIPGLADEAKIAESRIGLPVFHTDKIYFKGQPIALVIAETLEDATYAASLVEAQYTTKSFAVDFETEQEKFPLSVTGKERGSIDAWSNAEHVVEQEYRIKAEVHNPMEMHATIAQWMGEDKLKLYDKNQGVNSVQRTIGKVYNIPAENIEVISEFIGGGFGSGLRVWPHTFAAIMGAKKVGRPLKVVLTRQQMFSGVGYRPESWQKFKLGADKDGSFLGILHQARHSTSMYENFGEGITRVTRLIYALSNLKTESATVPLNLSTPTWMRGPGDCTGDFAVESAIDELCYKLNMDPVAIRLKNLSLEKSPETGLPWSTNYVNECIEKGAAMIDWKQRKSVPGQMVEGDWQIGYGMAVGMWNAGRGNASAAVILQKDGSITVQTAMTDIGTGTGTAVQSIAHEVTGIPKSKIKVELGNSNLPPAPSQGGSNGLSSVGGAVVAAIDALKLQLADQAKVSNVAYKDAKAADILLSEKGVSFQSANNQFITFEDILSKAGLNSMEAEGSSGPGEERKMYSFNSSAAHFCKVRVHSKTGKVKVEKMVCVADGGKIVSEKPAANQISGAAVGGIGMTLMEAMEVDENVGGLIADDLAGYHFSVNSDAPVIEVAFINKPDPNINPSGSKGLGEVGIIGCAAAIANAIYNATGKRMRDLPITPDKVLKA